MELSEKRTAAAVNYIESSWIKSSKLSSHGYGETVLLNGCDVNKNCTEVEHQKNRRTALNVTNFIEAPSFNNKSLSDIIEEEEKLKRNSRTNFQFKCQIGYYL